MAFYAISTLPLITSLQAASTVKQCWFADDASGAGRVTQIKDWSKPGIFSERREMLDYC
jgi:hypothetical protein